MGQVMMVQFQEARSLATSLNANLMKERRSVARQARRRNAYANFKKLVVKNKNELLLAAKCLTFGLLGGSVVTLLFIAYFLNSNGLSFDRLQVLEPIKPPVLVVIPSPPIDLPPVAASGDETVIRLKLSTDLFLTNLSGENQ
jgi:ABC-type nitrate/sulfonate/bicarbonate transport system substrate-binding protein